MERPDGRMPEASVRRDGMGLAPSLRPQGACLAGGVRRGESSVAGTFRRGAAGDGGALGANLRLLRLRTPWLARCGRICVAMVRGMTSDGLALRGGGIRGICCNPAFPTRQEGIRHDAAARAPCPTIDPRSLDDDDVAWISEIRRAIRDADTDYFRVSPCGTGPTSWSVSWRPTWRPVYLIGSDRLLAAVVAFPIAAFWLYRMGSLIHEVCHLGAHEMPAFKAAWNLLGGVMTLTPSPFFTRHHRDHHSRRFYGTPEDPEYVANVMEGGNREHRGYTLYVLAFPVLVFLRFLLVPLTFIHPAVREWTLRKASALTLNRRYERKLTPADRRAILVAEIPCFLRAALIPVLVLAGLNPWTRIPLLYALAVATVLLNQLRQLADHHFEGDGSRVRHGVPHPRLLQLHEQRSADAALLPVLDPLPRPAPSLSRRCPTTTSSRPTSISWRSCRRIPPITARPARLVERGPANHARAGLSNRGLGPVALRAACVFLCRHVRLRSSRSRSRQALPRPKTVMETRKTSRDGSADRSDPLGLMSGLAMLAWLSDGRTDYRAVADEPASGRRRGRRSRAGGRADRSLDTVRQAAARPPSRRSMPPTQGRMAGMFDAEGELVDEDGNVFTGRDEVGGLFRRILRAVSRRHARHGGH